MKRFDGFLFPILVLLAGCATEPTASDADVGDAADAEVDQETSAPPPRLRIEERPLTQLVDPMIGTDGPGNVIPGAVVPHGMIRLSPDTDESYMGIDAYDYGDPRIEGFTHTHLEGPGGSFNGYSQILLMPTTDPGARTIDGWASAFDHATEEASPGYYAVTLGDTGVRVELTASARSGVHRYTFPPGERRIVLDLAHSNGESVDGLIEQLSDTELGGYGAWNVHPLLDLLIGPEQPTGFSTVYFHIVSDTPFASVRFLRDSEPVTARQGDKLAANLALEPDAATVELRIGISFIDAAQARANLEAEVEGVAFEAVREAAAAAWNTRLNRVWIDASDGVKTRFYTALYHAMLNPADHTEVGGRFASGAAGEMQVFDAGDGRYYTDDWCMWDTFRTSHPLATLLEPETRGDLIQSMIHVYEQGGWLPKCTWTATGYSRVMIGNHAVPIIADAAVKGLLDFDHEKAWAAVEKAAMEDTNLEGSEGLCGYMNLGTVPSYLELGFVPHECDTTQSVSMTLEYAYDDWATARLAEALGRPADGAVFDERSASWRAHFNEESGFVQPLHATGDWVEPFDPADTGDDNDFTEASSWIYTWFVPHDLPGLFEAMGGPSAVEERLDAFFEDGHYDPSNQPSFHVPFLYTQIGRPEKTQTLVREILDKHFELGPAGLPGNDDAGSMSAWLVFAALGLYPLAPGDPRYTITTPLVDRAVIHLHPAHYAADTFTLETAGNGPYIHAATWNDAPLDRPWLTHEEITSSGLLHLELSPEPGSLWADSAR